MTEIVKIGDLARLKREIAEKDAEIERLKDELKAAQTDLNRADGINAMLRMQFNDLLNTLKFWKDSLGQVEMNVLEMKARLPE